MDLTVFTAIVAVVSEIISIANVFKRADEAKREKIAAWMQGLGELIQDVADKIELNDYPHNTCAQMEIMVERFPKVVGGILDKDTIDSLAEQLRSCCKVEQLFGELSTLSKKERDNNIVILLNASGKLRGWSSIIKYAE